MAIKRKKHTELGMRIAKAVGISKKNQAGFATLLGVHPSNLNRWISGEVAPSYEYISKIGYYSGVSLDWLLTGQEPVTKAGTSETRTMVPDAESDVELREIVDILRHDLPELKKNILKILRGRKQIKEGIADIRSLDTKIFFNEEG